MMVLVFIVIICCGTLETV